MTKKLVSIIIPIRNESKFINECLDSLLCQDYPHEKMEWIFVDGLSEDDTKRIINNYIKKTDVSIKIFNNKYKTVPYAMNIGIRNSIGKYIIRLDAHAKYYNNYIKECVKALKNIDCDNVGGIAITKSKTEKGRLIAYLLSTPFGVGNSLFRINGRSGYVDTVPFGAFKRETFIKYGLYDERLTRNQDNELNYRIRKNNGKIYLSNSIKFIYYCRDNVWDLVNMGFNNGKWNFITSVLCPGTMGTRHFVPFFFFLFVFFVPFLFCFSSIIVIAYFFILTVYILLDIIYTIMSRFCFVDLFKLLFLYPLFHLSYGLGTLIGIFSYKIYNRSYKCQYLKN